MGEHDNLEVSINIGRFGPYVKWGEQFVSIPKGEDISTVDLERAIQIISAKQKEDAPIGWFDEKPITKGKGRFIRQWPEEKIAIENGRWGPFIRFGKKMLKLTPGATGRYTPDQLTTIDLDTVKKMIISQEPKAFDKKAPAKKRAPAKKPVRGKK